MVRREEGGWATVETTGQAGGLGKHRELESVNSMKKSLGSNSRLALRMMHSESTKSSYKGRPVEAVHETGQLDALDEGAAAEIGFTDAAFSSYSDSSGLIEGDTDQQSPAEKSSRRCA
ncbi:hypothetical protein CYMTET_53969 [Cymbomonas tetramitiformis]|uniref:Uncharacterized protein n=1 Tax=Cymbomonas tetramitiformis TaxID=36881 RepID=A0AAE0BG63_9CHLO|nr:hypothetical protein CYMTET_53969 [Cymbomonas tetramitiformis]